MQQVHQSCLFACCAMLASSCDRTQSYANCSDQHPCLLRYSSTVYDIILLTLDIPRHPQLHVTIKLQCDTCFVLLKQKACDIPVVCHQHQHNTNTICCKGKIPPTTRHPIVAGLQGLLFFFPQTTRHPLNKLIIIYCTFSLFFFMFFFIFVERHLDDTGLGVHDILIRIQFRSSISHILVTIYRANSFSTYQPEDKKTHGKTRKCVNKTSTFTLKIAFHPPKKTLCSTGDQAGEIFFFSPIALGSLLSDKPSRETNEKSSHR